MHHVRFLTCKKSDRAKKNARREEASKKMMKIRVFYSGFKRLLNQSGQIGRVSIWVFQACFRLQKVKSDASPYFPVVIVREMLYRRE